MKLFEKDSAFDLAMRGFTQDYILNKTGFDVGYHNAKIKTQTQGINRMEYRAAFISINYDKDYIMSVIESYANGLGKYDVLAQLGVCGDRMIQLKVLFEMLGYLDEFKIADKSFRKLNMKNGTVEKYGVDNVFKLSEIQETAKQTRIDKYGAAYTLCKDSSLCETARTTQAEHMTDKNFRESVIEKRKATIMERYGVEYPVQSEDIKAKMQETCEERYGSASYLQSEKGRKQVSEYMLIHGKEHAKKSRKTCLKKYGVDNYAKTEESRKAQSERMDKYGYEIRMKMQETIQKRYGVPYYSQTEAFRTAMSKRMKINHDAYLEKSKQTSLQRYGFEYYTQTPEFRNSIANKLKQSCMQKYGVINYSQTKEFLIKCAETRRTNCSNAMSKPENELYKLLIFYFGKYDVIPQYYDERYPFRCDFYIKSCDLFIELNAMWTHGYHWFDNASNFDVKKSIEWLNDGRKFYKSAYNTWTKSDVNKRNTARLNKLNYVVFWKCNLSDAKQWFSLGCPLGQDWKCMYSWLQK